MARGYELTRHGSSLSVTVRISHASQHSTLIRSEDDRNGSEIGIIEESPGGTSTTPLGRESAGKERNGKTPGMVRVPAVVTFTACDENSSWRGWVGQGIEA